MTSKLRDVPFQIPATDRQKVADRLQAWLPDLIDLSLRLKQAHWNLRGPRFLSIHEQLDEVLVDAREAVDDVAERIVTLGGTADGRSQTVAETSRLGDFPSATMTVEQAIVACCGDLAKVSSGGRETIKSVAEIDPISEDLAIGIVSGFEKHHWMLDAQRNETE